MAEPHAALQFLNTITQYLVAPGQRIYWVYLLAAFLVGYAAYTLQHRRKNTWQDTSLLGFLRYAFPSSIYGHRSSWHDAFFFITNLLVQIFTLSVWFKWVQPTLSQNTQMVLGQTVPLLEDIIHLSPIAGIILYTFISFVVLDFSIYISHWAQHKWPLLWAFHQTHHSAEVLQPLTVYRMHPVDYFLSYGTAALFLGIVTGLCQFVSASPLTLWTVTGVNLFTFLFYLLGYNLRHTHIWVNYSPKVSQWLMSPAQHQIHHSNQPKHFDKNMGFALSVWDRWFGTLYIPVDDEADSLQYGLTPDQQAHYQRFTGLYFQPVYDALRWTREALTSPKTSTYFFKSTGWVLVCLLVITVAIADTQRQSASNLPKPSESVYLENLTWPDVKQALHTGYTSVIIPTGGTEQNGHHMVLGKHNTIVHYSAGRIADELGNTLVAPVMAYVPEGSIDPPEMHMKFPGTLSIPESVFRELLTAAAKSLKTHGFTRIYLLGDSGWNQAPQEAVANELSQQWASEGVKVFSVANYYDYGGEAWLMERGVSAQDLGTHASIRDTSELLAVDPEGVRIDQYKPNPSYAVDGSDGNPSVSDAAIGRFLIQQKIQRAVHFIRRTQ